MKKMTFKEIRKFDPVIDQLFQEASKVDDSEPNFCANWIWYNYFKPIIVGRVGWDRSHYLPENEFMGTHMAYDIVYQNIYQALPDCKNCGCF